MLGKLGSLLNSIYPDLCIACDDRYPLEGTCFCIHCLYELPFTDFHHQRDNLVEKFFWGRLKIVKGTALFFFQKGELVQEMIHRLKYKNQGFIGTHLGLHFGELLKTTAFMRDIDLIVPIPIHRSKKRIRNFNQSSLIAKGIGKINQIPVVENVLLKKSKTPSQTNKTREERIENLVHTFKIERSQALINKHVLLLDDILTTGATLEAAGRLLSKYDCKISIAVLAVGKY